MVDFLFNVAYILLGLSIVCGVMYLIVVEINTRSAHVKTLFAPYKIEPLKATAPLGKKIPVKRKAPIKRVASVAAKKAAPKKVAAKKTVK